MIDAMTTTFCYENCIKPDWYQLINWKEIGLNLFSSAFITLMGLTGGFYSMKRKSGKQPKLESEKN